MKAVLCLCLLALSVFAVVESATTSTAASTSAGAVTTGAAGTTTGTYVDDFFYLL